MAQAVLGSPSLSPLPSKSSSTDLSGIPASGSTIFGTQLELVAIEQTHLRKEFFLRLQTTMQPSGLTLRDKNVFDLIYVICIMSNPTFRLKASRQSPGLAQELINNKQKSIVGTQNGSDLFNDMKHRFLSFKKHKFLENLEHFQDLAKDQAPKFMVIACADSRVCPSSILGFQPGEAFVVRNVANLVPPFENGPSETNAALEFAVNSLEVENILVIGHSCCGGIRALMSMQDEPESSSLIRSWVIVGKNARLSTKAAASNLSFDQQCRHCEKESINRSLLNLLTYPWIEERVTKGVLSIHGGYYDFVDCNFEKWTLDYQESSGEEESGNYSLKDREFWC